MDAAGARRPPLTAFAMVKSSRSRPVFEQSDRRVESRRTQVRVPLSHGETLMFDQFLQAPDRRALHRQVRAERVTQDVNARRHFGPLGRVAHP